MRFLRSLYKKLRSYDLYLAVSAGAGYCQASTVGEFCTTDQYSPGKTYMPCEEGLHCLDSKCVDDLSSLCPDSNVYAPFPDAASLKTAVAEYIADPVAWGNKVCDGTTLCASHYG